MKTLIIAPHCSTGGMPAYVLAFIQSLLEAHDFHFAEFRNYSNDYTVQRDEIRRLVDWSCHNGNETSLHNLIAGNAWDCIHWQEEPGSFLTKSALSECLKLRQTSPWSWVLTSHELHLNYATLPYIADRYVAVSPWQANRIREQLPSADVATWEFPFSKLPVSDDVRKRARAKFGLDPNKRHLVQVGLWSAHKRQHWTLEAAAHLPPEWQVHFIGNRAENMRRYWEPLQLPKNCKAWGERDDVQTFLKACDAFVLPSSKELAPISLREAHGAGLPCLVSPLAVYEGSTIPLTFIDPERPESLAEKLQTAKLEPK